MIKLIKSQKNHINNNNMFKTSKMNYNPLKNYYHSNNSNNKMINN